jgi:hypothetical protein
VIVVDFMAAHPRVTLAAIGLLATLGYLLACWLWPFAACWWCEGGRKYQNERRKTWRRCGWCEGTGQRRRIGRVVWAYYDRSRKR